MGLLCCLGGLQTYACAFIGLYLVIKLYMFWNRQPRKVLSDDHETNIVVTGGVQGIGKLLVAKFAREHTKKLNLIVLDIADHLEKEMREDIAKTLAPEQVKDLKLHFYKCNLADADGLKTLWSTIIGKFKFVHILVNNAAICRGRLVDDLSIEQVKITMDINFHSYVQLMMMFMKQEAIANPVEFAKTNKHQKHEFHMVNVSSIAGHMTCAKNSDYSASKYALVGFLDALRQELNRSNSQVKLTNFYPYYINTGLFEGFKPKIGWILPTLDQYFVADRMYQAIMAEEKEVYIRPIIYWLKVACSFLPLEFRNYISHMLVGEGMEYFIGKVQKTN